MERFDVPFDWVRYLAVIASLAFVKFAPAYFEKLRRARLLGAYHSPTADGAIRKLGQNISPAIVHGVAIYKQVVNAVVYVVYGDFHKAESVMATIDWASIREPESAHRLIFDAVLAYLRGGYGSGYETSMKFARTLRVPVDSYDTDLPYSVAFVLVDIGRLLTRGDEVAEVRLQTKQIEPAFEPIALWALKQASSARAENAEAMRYLHALASVAPHAYGLGVGREAEGGSGPTVGYPETEQSG